VVQARARAGRLSRPAGGAGTSYGALRAVAGRGRSPGQSPICRTASPQPTRAKEPTASSCWAGTLDTV